MRVVFYNIKRILNGKLNLILFIIPIIAIGVFMMIFNASVANGSDDKKAFSDCKVGIVDLDNTMYTEKLIRYLDSKYSIRVLDEKEVNQFLIKNKINYSVTFEKGMTEDLIEGKNTYISAKSLKEGDIFKLFNEDLNTKILEAKAVGNISDSETSFYENLNDVDNGDYKIDDNVIALSNQSNDVGDSMFVFWGFIVFFLIYFNCNMGQRFLEDKLTNKIARIKTTSYGYSKYVLSLFISQILLGIIQISIMYLIIVLIGGDKINELVNGGTVLVLFLANLTGLSLSILISSISKSKNMFLALLNIIINVCAMLGGLYWPLKVMPNIVINISRCVPTYWLRTALDMSLKGNTFSDYTLNLFIVFLFSLGFIIASVLKEKIYKKAVSE